MLGFMFLSLIAAGFTIVLDDTSDEDLASTDDNLQNSSGSNSDELVPRQSFVEIDTGDRDIADLGTVEYLGSGQVVHSTDADPLSDVTGRDLNETFFGYSGGAIVDTGAGVDTVYAEDLQEGVIFAEAGDTVFGSNVDTNDTRLGVVMDGAGQFHGGTADELAVAIGDDAFLDGGAGNDLLFSEDGGTTLIGGDGDDFIDAAAFDNEYNQATNQTQGGPDAFVDIVDAGEGDDRIEDVANGDRVTLGAGSDLATAWYARDIALDPVVFTDFDPDEDRVFIAVTGFPMGQTGDPDQDYDLTGRFEILEADGDSHLFVDEELVAVFENTSGLIATSNAFIDESRDYYEARLVLG